MVLTEKQRLELHGAILEYLHSLGEPYAASTAAFMEDAGLQDNHLNGVGSTCLLEKKWTSIVRLQKKIMELESVAASGAGPPPRPGQEKGGGARSLPRAPPVHAMAGHRGSITAVATHPVYRVVASAGEDATIKVWDMDGGEVERTLKGHTNVVHGLAFSPDGTQLASCSADLFIKIWNFHDTYECVKTLRGHDHNISAVQWIPPGDRIVSCSRDHTVRLWETATGYCVGNLSGHTDWVRGIAVSPSGALLASCSSDHSVRIWSLSSAIGSAGISQSAGSNSMCIHVLNGHSHVVESVAFAGAVHEKVLGASGGVASEGHDMNGGDDAKSTGTPGGYVVSGGRDKSIRVWCLLSAQCIATYTDHNNWVRQVMFHPSAPLIFSCSDDRSIRVHDIKTGRCVRALEDAHSHFVTCLSIHATAPLLVSGGVDKMIHVWECH